MASIRGLKRDINDVLGDILDAVEIWQLANPEADQKKSEAISEDAISTFDDLMDKVNDRSVDNRAAHLKSVNKELEERARDLVERFNKL